MAQYIDKAAIVAEITKRLSKRVEEIKIGDSKTRPIDGSVSVELTSLVYFLNTLEVKEVDEKYERPTIEVTDDMSVASRMTYIDDELKPTAEFILNYASWNLHKDEWNQPVLEVPVFRVLDALAQRGKPYCEG